MFQIFNRLTRQEKIELIDAQIETLNTELEWLEKLFTRAKYYDGALTHSDPVIPFRIRWRIVRVCKKLFKLQTKLKRLELLNERICTDETCTHDHN